jgi:hypothetical protein
MVSVPAAVKAEIGGGGSGKTDYRHRARTGCVDNRWLSEIGTAPSATRERRTLQKEEQEGRSASRARCVRTALLLRRQFLHHLVQIEARGLLADREFLEALQPLPDHRLRRHDKEGTLRHPFVVFKRRVALLEWVGTQVIDLRRSEVGELPPPDVQTLVLLFFEGPE